MESSIKDHAARRALISSGIVALTTQLLVKQAGYDFESALPAGLAVALGFDYLTNLEEAKEVISTYSSDLFSYFHRSRSDWGASQEREKWNYQEIMSALLVTLGAIGGATVVLSRFANIGGAPAGGGPMFGPVDPIADIPYRMPYIPPPPVMPDAGGHGPLGLPDPGPRDVAYGVPADVVPVIEALNLRCLRAVRRQMSDRLRGGYDSVFDQQLQKAIRDSLFDAAHDLSHDILKTRYERGGCAVIEDGGQLHAVLWDDQQDRTRAVPLIRLDRDELEDAVREVVPMEPREDVLGANNMLGDILDSNGLTFDQVNEVMRYSPATFFSHGTLTVDAITYSAQWLVPGLQGQIESIQYADPESGEVLTVELPITDDVTLADYDMRVVDRTYFPGEELRLRGISDRIYVIVYGSGDGMYLAREIEVLPKGLKPGRLLLVPGDRFEGRAGHMIELPGYTAPTVADLGIADLDDMIDELEDLIEEVGSFDGFIAESIEWRAERGAFYMRMNERYLKVGDRVRAKAKPVTPVRILSDDEGAAYLGVRSVVKGRVQEIIHVSGSYALTVESSIRDGFWAWRKYYLMPLVELVEDTGVGGVSDI
jgi:hypothetical protein